MSRREEEDVEEEDEEGQEEAAALPCPAGSRGDRSAGGGAARLSPPRLCGRPGRPGSSAHPPEAFSDPRPRHCCPSMGTSQLCSRVCPTGRGLPSVPRPCCLSPPPVLGGS